MNDGRQKSTEKMTRKERFMGCVVEEFVFLHAYLSLMGDK